VQTDGAGCYIGKYFTAALPLLSKALGVAIENLHTSETGRGKTSLDGHFGTEGASLDRKIATGKHDTVDGRSVTAAKQASPSKATYTEHFQPNRCKMGKLKSQALSGTTAYSHRQYQYDSNLNFVAAKFYKQRSYGGEFLSSLGVEAEKWDAMWELRQPTSTGVITITPAALPEAGASVHKDGDAKAQEKKEKQEKKDSKKRKTTPVEDAWRKVNCAKGVYACPKEGCTRVFMKEAWLRKHTKAGLIDEAVHCVTRNVLRRGKADTNRAGTFSDAVARCLASPNEALGEERALLLSTRQMAVAPTTDSAEYTTITGEAYTATNPIAGWAAKPKRGGGKRYSPDQLRFVNWCYYRGVGSGSKLKPDDAQYLMTIVGTAPFNTRFPDAETAAEWPNSGCPFFRPMQCMDHWVIKPFFSSQQQAFDKKMEGLQQAATPAGIAASNRKVQTAVVKKLKVADIKVELESRGLSTAGNRPELAGRLVDAQLAEQNCNAGFEADLELGEMDVGSE